VSMTERSPSDGIPIDEAEWQAQERGMHAALEGDLDPSDATSAGYRAVAQALRSAPRSQPPIDFAATLAERVVRRDAGMERALSRALLVALMATLIVSAMRYGGRAWHSLQQAFGDVGLGWILAGVGCLALSWLGSRLREHVGAVLGPGQVS
jgi:hypothetical protein